MSKRRRSAFHEAWQFYLNVIELEIREIKHEIGRAPLRSDRARYQRRLVRSRRSVRLLLELRGLSKAIAGERRTGKTKLKPHVLIPIPDVTE